MRIGVCFFMESNLGGAGTQADDLVTAAKRLGHEACLLRFTSLRRAHGLLDLSVPALPSHRLLIRRAGMKMESNRILLTLENVPKIVAWLNNFDLLLFVGGCPHITRNFQESDFHNLYKPLYTKTKCHKVMFFTDPFWQKLYPYAKDVIGSMDRVYAFAEAYRRILLTSDLTKEVEICNFGSIAALSRSDKLGKGIFYRSSTDVIVWPHQWRSWKNPELLIRMAPYLERSVHAYADGIEYHKLRRDRPKEWKRAVEKDYTKEGQPPNPNGRVAIFGTVPQSEIMDAFATCRWMLDLTGMSGRTGKQMEKFVGNYQCVNIETMMLGCVNFKYENTIKPYSQIPAECVIAMPLVTEPEELAKFINSNLYIDQYQKVATRAREWALDKFNPLRVFKKCFVDPFK